MEQITSVHGPSSEEAAVLAQAAEAALKELEPEPLQAKEPPREDAALRSSWRVRIAALERKVASEKSRRGTTSVPCVASEDVTELEEVAKAVVAYRDELKKAGYTNKTLKDDFELKDIEDRLDQLSESLLSPKRFVDPEDAPKGPDMKLVVQQLAQRERQLVLRLAQRHDGLSPSESKELEQLILNVTERKAHLSTEGLSQAEQDKDEQVMNWLIRLQELRSKEVQDKKRTKAHGKEVEADMEELEQLEEDLQKLKRQLKDEQDWSKKDLKHDPTICELTERLVVLRKLGGA